MNVDGIRSFIELGRTKMINGIRIKLVSSHYDDDESNRYANLEFCPTEGIITTTKIISTTTSLIKTTTLTMMIPTTTLKFCDMGCLHNDVCVPFGFRIILDGLPSYCDIDKNFKLQKDVNEPCMNNYECNSNECSNCKCISTYNLLEKIFDIIKNFFTFGKGKFVEIFGKK